MCNQVRLIKNKNLSSNDRWGTLTILGIIYDMVCRTIFSSITFQYQSIG